MVYEGVTKQQTLMAMNVEGGMHTYSAVLFPLLIYLLVFLLVQSFSGYDIIRNLFKKYKWRMVLTALIECIVFNYLTDLIGWNTISSGVSEDCGGGCCNNNFANIHTINYNVQEDDDCTTSSDCTKRFN